MTAPEIPAPLDPRAPTGRTVEALFRAESGRVLATLIGTLGGDFQIAEDAVQDAFLAALEHWPADGVPDRPGAWITTTARRKALDRLRRARRLVEKEALLQALAEPEREGDDPAALVAADELHITDDRLRLICTCCHPILSPESRVALTLRTVAGLQTPAIARAFLVPEPTVAQRLVRAKRTIRSARIPYQVPGPEELPERLASVLLVLYLVFTEGYRQPVDDPLEEAATGPGRASLTAEAIRLGRLMIQLVPGDAEVHGLLALMLLQDARRPARVDAQGELVLLEDQDRGRWDRAAIAEGQAVLARAIHLGPAGPYQLQAAIALEHDLAPDAEATDWPAIITLFRRLDSIAPSPVVALNHAVAVSMIEGPEAALARVADWSGDRRMRQYHLYHAVIADLYRRTGDRMRAAEAYRAAIPHTVDAAERRYLERRLASLGLGRSVTGSSASWARKAGSTTTADLTVEVRGPGGPKPRRQ